MSALGPVRYCDGCGAIIENMADAAWIEMRVYHHDGPAPTCAMRAYASGMESGIWDTQTGPTGPTPAIAFERGAPRRSIRTGEWSTT